MGGYGSSRWGMTVTRMTTEGLPRLDVRVLAREGCLVFGTSAMISWHSGESVWASITTQVHADEPDTLILEYSTLASTGSWMPTRERIALETTSCHYGGERCYTQLAVTSAVGRATTLPTPVHEVGTANSRRGGRPCYGQCWETSGYLELAPLGNVPHAAASQTRPRSTAPGVPGWISPPPSMQALSRWSRRPVGVLRRTPPTRAPAYGRGTNCGELRPIACDRLAVGRRQPRSESLDRLGDTPAESQKSALPSRERVR